MWQETPVFNNNKNADFFLSCFAFLLLNHLLLFVSVSGAIVRIATGAVVFCWTFCFWPYLSRLLLHSCYFYGSNCKGLLEYAITFNTWRFWLSGSGGGGGGDIPFPRSSVVPLVVTYKKSKWLLSHSSVDNYGHFITIFMVCLSNDDFLKSLFICLICSSALHRGGNLLYIKDFFITF